MTDSGGVKCWGENLFWQLGDGSNIQRGTPVDVSGLASGVTAVAGGGARTCALTDAGGVKCWGYGSGGLLGNEDSVWEKLLPVNGVNPNPGFAGAYGEVSFTTAALARGPHSLTVDFPGDDRHAPSTSAPLVQIVEIETETDLSSSASNTVFGDTVTFTAVVSSAGGEPTGPVTFRSGGTTLGTRQLSGGVARLAVSSLAAGNHTIVAAYAGDTGFLASTSSGLSQQVESATTKTALSLSPASSTFGQSVTLNASVSSPAGTPKGSVRFTIGGATLGDVPLSNGAAAFTANGLDVGRHRIKAAYLGTANHAASSSSAKTHTVGKGGTRTTAKAKPAKPQQGKTVRLIATVKAQSPAKGRPDGKVQFRDGSANLGTVTLKRGKATLKTKRLKAGKRKIRVAYRGASNWKPSSAKLTVRVSKKKNKEFQVNTYADGTQFEPSAAPLADGGYVVVWASDAQDGAGFGIYAQRYDDDDTPVGAEMRLNAHAAGSQSAPVVAGPKAGGFVVAWQTSAADRSNAGVFVRRFDASGLAAGTETALGAALERKGGQLQAAPALTVLEDGGYYVVWAVWDEDRGTSDLFGRRFDAEGMAAGPAVVLAADVAGDDPRPEIASLADGSIAVTWAAERAGGFRIAARRYDADGAAETNPIRVTAGTVRAHPRPVIAGLADGDLAIAWLAKRGKKAPSLVARVIPDQAARQRHTVRIVGNIALKAGAPDLIATEAGGFTVSWAAFNGEGSGSDIYGQAFTAVGKAAGNKRRINVTSKRDQWQPSLFTTSDGGSVAIWTSQKQDGSKEGIFGRRFGKE